MTDKTDANETYCFEHASDRPCPTCAYMRAAELIYIEKAPRSSSTDFDELSPQVQEPYFRFAGKLLNTLREEGHIASGEKREHNTSENEGPTTQQVLLALARRLKEQIEVTEDKMEGLGYLNVYVNIREEVDEMDKWEEEQKGGKKS